ncbi:hypothetical protein C1645_747334 [Glomus cerebriforme]|uniref:Uncharacterized protein n=1 Tax=Glomus cerebriforme TaxID=658196 RepID=A0A397TRD8_9GLOM|nr:hypothetical protein C1645_747334 [Glomus cerebriforme]
MDKKDTTSSISSLTDDGKIVSGSSLPLDESFKEFKNAVNDKLANMDQNIDTKVADIQKNMQEFFKEIMKKLENIESKQES